jgi:hypothetical protein
MPIDVNDLLGILGQIPPEPVSRPLGTLVNPGSLEQQLAMAGVQPVGQTAMNGTMPSASVTRAVPSLAAPFRSLPAPTGFAAPTGAPVAGGALGGFRFDLASQLGGAALTPQAQAVQAAGRSRFAPVLGRGALMRGLGYGGAGLLAGQVAGNVLDNEGSNVDEGISGALTGAGVGAGVGSIFPVLGTGVGAGVGALAGGALGLFGPKNTGTAVVAKETANQQKQLDKLVSQFGLSPESQAQLQMQLAVGLQGLNSKDQVKQVFQQATQLLPGLWQQEQMGKQDAARAAAVYAMLLPSMNAANSAASQTAGDLQAAMQSAAGGISDPNLRSVYNARAAEIPAIQSRTNQNQLLQLALADAGYAHQAQQQAQQQQAGSVDPALLQQLGL